MIFFKGIKNRGMSIMEVLVATGLLSIVSLGVMSMISSQNKEVTALTERLGIKDVEAQLVNVMNVADFCSCLMRGLTLNTTTAPMTLSSNPVDIPVGYNQPIPVPLTTPCTPNSANRIVPSGGNKIAGYNVRVNTITYTDINPIGSSKYSANLKVSFDPSSGVRPHADIKAAVIFTVNSADPAAAQRFQACGSAVPAASAGCRMCKSCGGSWPVYAGTADTKDADWSGSEVLDWGCGGGMAYYNAPSRAVARLCCAN